ncbi:MAG: hypothetical protein IAG13_17575, partial [Deltaproteobacteria bacterium]|nr:hypothetical protein [Nannocystaceae bacterium]
MPEVQPLHVLVADAVTSTGLPAARIVGAVRVGIADEAVLARAREALPRVPLLSLAPEQREPALAVMRWCVGLRLDPSRVAWWIEDGTSTGAAVRDVLWSCCAGLLAELGARPSIKGELAGSLGDLLRDWADLCFEHGVLHAALPAYLLLERGRPAKPLASRIAITWAKLGCPGRACEWLKRSDIPTAARTAALADFV